MRHSMPLRFLFVVLASSDLCDATRNHVRQNAAANKIKKSPKTPTGSRVRGRKQRQIQQSALEIEDNGIVGGTDAEEGEFPFYVKFEGGVLCGGSLISPDTILTAAHCVDNGTPSQVRIGATEFYGGMLVETQCAISHPDFIESAATLMNDVAVIKLKNPISSPSLIRYNTDTGYPREAGMPLNVIGFGITEKNKASPTLQKLTTNFVTVDQCIDTYTSSVVTSKDHICADVDKAGDCNGDSGGPVFDNNGLQVGIVSFGYGGCASNNFQDVYVNVANFAPWIRSYVNGEECRPGEDVTTDTDVDTDTPANDGQEGDNTDFEDPVGADGTIASNETDTTDAPTVNADEVESDDEASDLDALLDCFQTVLELVQNVLGLTNDKGGKGGDNKGGEVGGKGVVEPASTIVMRSGTAPEEESNEGGSRGFVEQFWN